MFGLLGIICQNGTEVGQEEGDCNTEWHRGENMALQRQIGIGCERCTKVTFVNLRTDWFSFGSTDQPYIDVNDHIFALMFTIQLITF